MSQSTIPAEVNKKICEASGCFAEATVKIEVKVAQQRTIILELCKNCMKQFQNNDDLGCNA